MNIGYLWGFRYFPLFSNCIKIIESFICYYRKGKYLGDGVQSLQMLWTLSCIDFTFHMKLNLDKCRKYGSVWGPQCRTLLSMGACTWQNSFNNQDMFCFTIPFHRLRFYLRVCSIFTRRAISEQNAYWNDSYWSQSVSEMRHRRSY